MTDVSMEILEQYQVRKTKKQKKAFRVYAETVCARFGYTAKEEKGLFGVRNLVVGDVDRAKVIYTAHYDTCAQLPFPNFITPKRFDLYLLYQVALLVMLFVPAWLLGVAVGFVSGVVLGALSVWLNNPLVADIGAAVVAMGVYLLFMAVLFAGPANKHTVNDNTSGVTVLFNIMAALPADKRDDVAFVFFDLEEAGMFGSAAFAAKHKTVTQQTPLINFDCVSDGEHVLFAVRRHARDLCDKLTAAFTPNEQVTVDVCIKGVFYPSDQINFKKGVGVAALKKTKRGILYMNRIHTKHDTVYREETIDFLTAGAVKLADFME